MSTDSTAADVFEEVEADPDAILEEYDAETPSELVESGGKHEACLEDDVDDVTATELFADLEDEIADAAGDTGTGEPHRTDAADSESDPITDLEFEFVGDADVTLRDDGDAIDDTAAELDALTATDSTAGGATDRANSAETATASDPIETATAPDSVETATASDSIETATAHDSVETATASDPIETDTAPDSVETATAPDSDSSGAPSSDRLTVRDGETDELVLVGPAPPTTRVANDTFGSASIDAVGGSPTDAY